MNRTIRAVVWGLVVGSLLSLSCSSESNPPEPPNGGTGGGASSTGDGGPDDGGGGGGGAGGGGGGATYVPCRHDGGDTPSYGAVGNTLNNISRVVIQRMTANDQPQCVRITLELSDGGVTFGDGGLSVPTGWRLFNATLRDRACGAGGPAPEVAANVIGTVTFADAGNPFPPALDVNALVQAASGSSLPQRTCVDRVNLTVQ